MATELDYLNQASQNAANREQSMMRVYLRQLGFDEAEARAYAGRQRSRINRQRDMAVPARQEQGTEDRRNIGLNREQSGLYRSGETERRFAKSRASELGDIGAIEGGAADQLGEVEGNLAREVARVQREKAEVGGYGY